MSDNFSHSVDFFDFTPMKNIITNVETWNFWIGIK